MTDVLGSESNRLELRAVLLFVDDFQQQLRFYRDVLGFEVGDEESGEGYVRLVDWVMLKTGGSLFELFDKRVHGGPLPLDAAGNTALPAFEVRDVAAAWERLAGNGVTTLTTPQRREWGTFFFFEDPERNVLQAYQLSDGPASPP
jgi:lactoylglutathione lyase